jgi:glycosyltransferase involved in cell wall biosynthesis
LKVVQINTTLNTGSTGRIAEEIGQTLIEAGHTSYIAHGRPGNKSKSKTIKIGSSFDQKLHGLQTRIFDTHAFGSATATKKLIEEINCINPDIVHLHNLHGYYIHVGLLFDFLKEKKKPVVWTLHDCWSFTGHCSYFDFVNCPKWKTHCEKCPVKTRYPESYVFDNSYNNFDKKKEVFNGVDNLTLVTPSNWLKDLLQLSFLNSYPVSVIHNGVDLKTFHPLDENKLSVKQKLNIGDEAVILGVASVWDRRKGLKDFIELSQQINPCDKIILLGLTAEQQKGLPQNIIALQRTESLDEMVQLYNLATVFVNPTWVDNFPTTNIEALACGTPVITYNTGGSIEAVDEQTGLVVEKGDIQNLALAIETIKQNGKKFYTSSCRQRAEHFFNNKERTGDYISLYQSVLNRN